MNLKEESQNPHLFHADNVTKGRKRKEKKAMGKVSGKQKKVQQKLKVEQMDLVQYVHYTSSLNQVSTVVFNKVSYFTFLIIVNIGEYFN